MEKAGHGSCCGCCLGLACCPICVLCQVRDEMGKEGNHMITS